MKAIPEVLFDLAALGGVAAAAWFLPRGALAVLGPAVLLTLVLMVSERLAGRS